MNSYLKHIQLILLFILSLGLAFGCSGNGSGADRDGGGGGGGGAAGALDRTFNGTGILILNATGILSRSGRNEIMAQPMAQPQAVRQDKNDAVAVVATGTNKVLIAGNTSLGAGSEIFVLKLNNDGSLDTSFNPNGTTPGVFILKGADFPGSPTSVEVKGMALDSSDNIFVTGVDNNGFMIVARLDSVAQNAAVTNRHVGNGGNGSLGQAIAVDSADRIIVAGRDDGGAAIAVWRLLNADLSGDTTFASNGRFNIGSLDGRAMAVAVVSGGNNEIVGAGFAVSGANGDNDTDTDLAVFRLDYDTNNNNLARLDPSFNTTGIAFATEINQTQDMGEEEPTDMLIDSNRLVVVGKAATVGNAATTDMAIWAFSLTAGTVDATFGNNGVVTHDSAAGGAVLDEAHAIAIDTSGRYVVAGVSVNATPDDDLAVWRFSSAGALDTSFNTQGFVAVDDLPDTKAQLPQGDADDIGRDVAIDSSGKIVVVGEARILDQAQTSKVGVAVRFYP